MVWSSRVSFVTGVTTEGSESRDWMVPWDSEISMERFLRCCGRRRERESTSGQDYHVVYSMVYLFNLLCILVVGMKYRPRQVKTNAMISVRSIQRSKVGSVCSSLGANIQSCSTVLFLVATTLSLLERRRSGFKFEVDSVVAVLVEDCRRLRKEG